MLPPKDLIRLRHMIEAARQLLAFVQGRQQSDLAADLQFSFAVQRAMEILGEAAAQVSQETRQRLPMIPWLDIVGIRNRLIHAYFQVDDKVVWETVTRDLPVLLQILESAAAEVDAGA